MHNKISAGRVRQYGMSYATAVADRFFAAKDRIEGGEILRLCHAQQVNFFVVRELLKSWRLESERHRSPYFDYRAPAVEQALSRFLNTLSSHISITKEHFVPLLEKSVSLTLYLILSPYDFYAYTLKGYDRLGIDRLREEMKYIKINRPPLEALVQKLEQRHIESVSGASAFELLEQTLEELRFVPEDVDPHISQLDEAFPLEVEKLYDDAPSASELIPFPFEEKPRPTKVLDRPMRAPDTAPPTVASAYRKAVALKASGFTLNQKFMFTRSLFNGDANLFNNTVVQLDSMGSLDEAMQYLRARYPHWDQKSEEYEEFLELLFDRFS